MGACFFPLSGPRSPFPARVIKVDIPNKFHYIERLAVYDEIPFRELDEQKKLLPCGRHDKAGAALQKYLRCPLRRLVAARLGKSNFDYFFLLDHFLSSFRACLMESTAPWVPASPGPAKRTVGLTSSASAIRQMFSKLTLRSPLSTPPM